MSSPDIYVAVKGDQGTVHSANLAPSAVSSEVERIWKVSKAKDSAGETVSGLSWLLQCSI